MNSTNPAVSLGWAGRLTAALATQFRGKIP